MSKKMLLIALAIVALIAIGEAAWLVGDHLHIQHHATGTAAQHFVPLTITLQNGQLPTPPQTYLVKQGTNLQFTINSTVLGKIGAPVSPAQTITFTHSPLVFHFTAGKLGNFPMTYEANGSKKVILLANITVHANK